MRGSRNHPAGFGSLILLIVLSATLGVFAACGDDSDGSFYCGRDSYCHPGCESDPDCAGSTPPTKTETSSASTGQTARATNAVNATGDAAVVCPSGEVTIKSAADLRRIAGCTTISGNLVVDSASISGFRGLEALSTITGSLLVSDNAELTSFVGLNALTALGGDLRISYNKQLVEVDALAGLTQIAGSVQIRANAALSSLKGFSNVVSISGDLYVRANPGLTTLEGLDALTWVGGLFVVGQNYALPSCEVKDLYAHVGSAGTRQICENLQDDCGWGRCPEVW